MQRCFGTEQEKDGVKHDIRSISDGNNYYESLNKLECMEENRCR